MQIGIILYVLEQLPLTYESEWKIFIHIVHCRQYTYYNLIFSLVPLEELAPSNLPSVILHSTGPIFLSMTLDHHFE